MGVVALLSAGPPDPLTAAAQCPDGSPPPCRPQVARAAAPAPNSVAVLYFDNLSRDTADAYLADGITEEIIARLGQIERLRVKSRTAVQHYRSRSADGPAVLGRTLGVAHLVNGTLRRAGPRLRVSVELVRAATGDRVWGDQYDRTQADLFAIQEDIARSVATAIAGRLLPAERAVLLGRPTRDPRAYDHLLRGNYYLAQRTARSAVRAIAEYESAARLDPEFTNALARIAYAHALMLYWGWEYPGVTAESHLVRGLTAADRALQRDSTTSDGWMARAYLLSFRHPATYEGVRAAFQRAIALDPGNAEAYHQYCGILAELGDDAAATDACHRALDLEPERPITLVQLADLRYAGHRFAEARRWLDSALVLDAGFQFAYAFRGAVRLRLNDLAGARDDAETALRLAAGLSIPAEAVRVFVAARAGDSTVAQARVEWLVRTVGQLYRPSSAAFWLSAALVSVSRHEAALDLLERLEPRGIRLWDYLSYPEFDPIRSHQRFQRLVEESRPQ